MVGAGEACAICEGGTTPARVCVCVGEKVKAPRRCEARGERGLAIMGGQFVCPRARFRLTAFDGIHRIHPEGSLYKFRGVAERAQV